MNDKEVAFCKELIETICNQEQIIEDQRSLINVLERSLKQTEKSREYWVNKYYELQEELQEVL